MFDGFNITVKVACAMRTEEEVKDTFWKELERTIEDVDPGYRTQKLYMIGDLNGWRGQSRRRIEW